jgi:hypothetical protein
MLPSTKVRHVSNPSDIDVTFDLRSDTPLGKDPDTHSPTLRRYHQILWSKTLPSGARFDLSSDSRGAYLRHTSQLGDFILTSDASIRTFRRVRKASAVINQVPKEAREAFSRQGYTIGGMMIFPGRRVGGKQTINQRRGTHPRISDRLDLTLECIRRYYLGEPSPLDETLARYDCFFALFRDLQGYVDYFLLQDLVTHDYRAVRFFAPFDNFTTAAIPRTLNEYEAYRTLTLQFVEARNARIAASLEAR